MSDEWVRVGRDFPCPVCGKPDWCVVSRNGEVAICPRTESPHHLGEAGWLHRLVEKERVPARAPAKKRERRVLKDIGFLAEKYKKAVQSVALEALAKQLGVEAWSLRALEVGWSREHMAWSFPMWNTLVGFVTGIRLRRTDGTKFSVKGGTEGLFMPEGLRQWDTLLVCEGVTDVAAALTVGFSTVVGRASCTSGVSLVVELVREFRPTKLLIVADRDGPGLKGAADLAEKLKFHHPDPRVVTPPEPHKDLRDWVRAGAKRSDIEGGS